MTRRRRARSNLYQVDFVAALFGAFLLLWISKPTGSTGEPETAVVVMESSCEDQVSILPEGAERCVDKDVLQLTDPSLNLQACAFKPDVTPGWIVPLWDEKGPVAALASFDVSSRATGRNHRVEFSGLAVVVADPPGHKFRAVGYGSATPPDQISGATYKGWIGANICEESSCPLYHGQFDSSLKRRCTIRLYSRAWPEMCLRATVQTGDAALPFDLKPCRS